MVFEFARLDRPVDENVRELARDELQRAIAEVDDSGLELRGTVRSVRRRLKRVRAALKLVRPIFPDYPAENQRLRSIAAHVAELRDLGALLEAVDHLAVDVEGAPWQPLLGLRRQLAERVAAREADVPRESFLADLRARLEDARQRAATWHFTASRHDAVLPGFVRTYGRARAGYRDARRSGDVVVLHEWRKTVKDHWSQLGVLRGLAPPLIAVRRAAVKDLAAALGDHHNLHVLRAGLPWMNLDSPDSSSFVRLLDSAGDRLARRSLRLGAALFSEPPAVVERRWRAYVDEWRAVSSLLPRRDTEAAKAVVSPAADNLEA